MVNPFFRLPSIFPSTRVFSNESANTEVGATGQHWDNAVQKNVDLGLGEEKKVCVVYKEIGTLRKMGKDKQRSLINKDMRAKMAE